jgi:hypothetical protein
MVGVIVSARFRVNVFVARIIDNEYDGTVTYKRLTGRFDAARRAMVESGPPLPG